MAHDTPAVASGHAVAPLKGAEVRAAEDTAEATANASGESAIINNKVRDNGDNGPQSKEMGRENSPGGSTLSARTSAADAKSYEDSGCPLSDLLDAVPLCGDEDNMPLAIPPAAIEQIRKTKLAASRKKSASGPSPTSAVTVCATGLNGDTVCVNIAGSPNNGTDRPEIVSGTAKNNRKQTDGENDSADDTEVEACNLTSADRTSANMAPSPTSYPFIDNNAVYGILPNVANFRDVAISIGGWISCRPDKISDDNKEQVQARGDFSSGNGNCSSVFSSKSYSNSGKPGKGAKGQKPGIYIKPFNLYRSARLDSITHEELDLLTNMFCIRCVIDLRSEIEASSSEHLADCFPASFISEELMLKSLVHAQVAGGSTTLEPPQAPIMVKETVQTPLKSTFTGNQAADVVCPALEQRPEDENGNTSSEESIQTTRKNTADTTGALTGSNEAETAMSRSGSDSDTSGHTAANSEQSCKATTCFSTGPTITRVTYKINFAGNNFRRNSVWKPLTTFQKMKVIGLMATGNRPKVVEMVGHEILQPGGLLGLNKNFIDYCGQEIVQALRLMTFRENYPILVHCTQGKDRTGIVIGLALYCAGVKEELILKDYHRSQKGLDSKREEMVKEMSKTGLGPEFADAPLDVLRDTFVYIRTKYGSVDRYLDRNGFFSGDRLALRNCLVYVNLGMTSLASTQSYFRTKSADTANSPKKEKFKATTVTQRLVEQQH